MTGPGPAMTAEADAQGLPDVVMRSPGHRPDNGRLQPWAYLANLATGLARAGRQVAIVGEGPPSSLASGVRLVPRRSASLVGWTAGRRRPETAVWSLGPASMLRLRAARVRQSGDRVVAVVPGPWYSLRELRQAGAIGLFPDQRASSVHVAAAMVPERAFGRFLREAADAIVVPTVGLAEQLRAADTRLGDKVHVVPHGKDPAWDEAPVPPPPWLAEVVGDTAFAVNFGPARAVRGVHELAEASRRAGIPCLFLVRADRGDPATAALRSRVRPAGWVHDAPLAPQEVRAVVARAHVAALPFRLVQSVVPAAVLESMQAGVPVVTTSSGPLPSLVGAAGDASSKPRDTPALAKALAGVWEPAVHDTCSRAARRQMREHPTVAETAAMFASIVEAT